jgi:predicted dinucleotide-binding enzyme
MTIGTIGIIGAGALGSSFARLLARNGLSAIISNRRGPASLAGLAEELGPSIRAGTVEEAGAADMVLVAVRWVDAEKVLGRLPEWNGRIVIDGTNPVEFLDPGSAEAADPGNPLAAYGIRAVDLGARHSSQIIEQFVPGARLVKAFNHNDVGVFREPESAGGKRVLFYSGDDVAAKAEVRAMMEACGFAPVDLGALAVGGPLSSLPFGPLAMHNFLAC